MRLNVFDASVHLSSHASRTLFFWRLHPYPSNRSPTALTASEPQFGKAGLFLLTLGALQMSAPWTAHSLVPPYARELDFGARGMPSLKIRISSIIIRLESSLSSDSSSDCGKNTRNPVNARIWVSPITCCQSVVRPRLRSLIIRFVNLAGSKWFTCELTEKFAIRKFILPTCIAKGSVGQSPVKKVDVRRHTLLDVTAS